MENRFSILWTSRYSFAKFGAFELNTFSFGGYEYADFNDFFRALKEGNGYKSSMAYFSLKRPEANVDRIEFGNFDFKKIQSQDFVELSFDEVVSRLMLGRGKEFDDSTSQQEKRFLFRVHEEMSRHFKAHVAPSDMLFELRVPITQQSKLASSISWDVFFHCLAINRRDRILNFITVGDR